MSLCKRLVFTSNLVNEYGRDLPDLLNQSANHNTAFGTSTMLLSNHGKLIQTIEGDPNLVSQLWQRLRHDARYFDQCIVHEETINTPSFHGTQVGLGNYVLVGSDKFQKEVQIFALVPQEIERRLPAGLARDHMTQFVAEYA